MHKITSIQYCGCGYPLSVLTTSAGGIRKREFVDWTSPTCRLVRCPRCFAALDGKEAGSGQAARRRESVYAWGA
jgi:hypothetical protein